MGEGILQNVFARSEAITSADDLRQLISQGLSLSRIPIQPLYQALRTSSPQEVAAFLPFLSHEQRQVLMDIDLWEKDELKVEEFPFWIEAYAACEDEETRFEFVEGTQFASFLKGRLNIQTFDVDEPEYPDHDRYFLTDDGLLLFEYDEDFSHANEVKALVLALYSRLGVEKAYAHLFKVVSANSTSVFEDEYQMAKTRMAEHGFVDYYDALGIQQPFPSFEHLDSWIIGKKGVTPELDESAKGEVPPANEITVFKKGLDSLTAELDKISDNKRRDYLAFNFTRTINASLSFHRALHEGAVATARVGEKTKNFWLLGLDYLKTRVNEDVFSRFDFTDLTKIGNTLFILGTRPLKKALITTGFEADRVSFLGKYWNEYLENTWIEIFSFRAPENSKPVAVSSMKLYENWKTQGDLLQKLLPLMAQFVKISSQLQKEGVIQDSFYRNYKVSELDFEALLLSVLVNFAVGNKQGLKKLGVTVEELNLFWKKAFDLVDERDKKQVTRLKSADDQVLKSILQEFIKNYGLAIDGCEEYLRNLLEEHLGGHSPKILKDGEYRFIGGPILLV
jgi:hypothetical protein